MKESRWPRYIYEWKPPGRRKTGGPRRTETTEEYWRDLAMYWQLKKQDDPDECIDGNHKIHILERAVIKMEFSII